MATLSAIRTALAAQVANTGVTALATIPDSINAPVAVVAPAMPGAFLRYGDTFDGGYTLLLSVRLYVSRWDAPSAQNALDPYMAPTGSTSVYKAIEDDPSLGGTVDSAAVIDVRGYGKYTIADIDYIGAEWLVQIMAS